MKSYCEELTWVKETLRDVKASVKTIASDNRYPETLFLGTGATIGKLNRNNSSILLNLSPNQSILLDCGEATFAQLYRYFGDKLDRVIQQIVCIFVSHLHVDHYMGVIKILLERKRLQNEFGVPPIVLVAPHHLNVFLKIFSEEFESLHGTYKLISAVSLTKPPDKGFDLIEYKHLCHQLQLKEFRVVPVNHCKHAYGISLTSLSGFKLVFSGDTRPCETLIRSGQDCDLLIHDSTCDNHETNKALETKHSTTQEAISIGQQANAKLLLLTHFNHYYPRIPQFNNFPNNVAVAFDFMKISPGYLRFVNSMLPSLQKILPQYQLVMEKKAEELLHLVRKKRRQVQIIKSLNMFNSRKSY